MMKSKSVKVADVVITSEKTGEILRGTVIDAGSRIQGKVNYIFNYTQCTVKLRSNFEKIAQLKCTTNEKRNLSEHDEKNFKLKNFL